MNNLIQEEINLVNKLFEQQKQVQYSLYDQIVILRFAANRLGLYDAADYLQTIIDRSVCNYIQDNKS